MEPPRKRVLYPLRVPLHHPRRQPDPLPFLEQQPAPVRHLGGDEVTRVVPRLSETALA